MSAGMPPPGSGSAPSLYTLDDAVELLDHLVDAANVQNDLTRATNFLLMAGGKGLSPSAGSGGSGGSGGGSGGRRGKRGSSSKRSGRRVSRGAKIRAAGGKIGESGGAIGRVIGGFVKLVGVLVEARDAVHSWTEAQFETARRLSAVSGSMASVVAQRDVDQMFRDMERGERTAGSAAKLAEAEGQRKDEENKLAIAFDNAKNEVLTVFNNVLTRVLQVLNKGVQIGNEILKNATFGAIDLLKEEEAGVSTLDNIGANARDAVAKMDAAGNRLMDIARAAVRLGGAAPNGAAPLGGIPGRIP